MIRKPKRTSANGRGRVRITLSIPKTLWPFFERQRKKPKHAGNRSSYIRSLIAEQMQRSERVRHEV